MVFAVRKATPLDSLYVVLFSPSPSPPPPYCAAARACQTDRGLSTHRDVKVELASTGELLMQSFSSAGVDSRRTPGAKSPQRLPPNGGCGFVLTPTPAKASPGWGDEAIPQRRRGVEDGVNPLAPPGMEALHAKRACRASLFRGASRFLRAWCVVDARELVDPVLAGWSDEDAPIGISNEEVERLYIVPAPGFLYDYIERASHHTSAGYMLHLGAALGVLSALAPPELHIRRYMANQEGNVWPMLVGGSGSFKTTCIHAAERILLKVCPSRLIPAGVESPQGLKGYFQREFDQGVAQPQGTIVFPEMMGFLEKSAKPGPFREVRSLLTELYDPGGLSKLTMHEDNTFKVPYARMTVLGGVTPSTLETTTTPGDWLSGFSARFLWLGAPPRQNKPDISRDADYDIGALIDRAGAIQNKQVVPTAGLTAEAAAFLDANENLVKSAIPRLDEGLHGLFNRFQATVLRLALLHAYSTRPLEDPSWRLALWDVVFGVRVTWASLSCALQVYRRLAFTPHQQLRRATLQFLQPTPRSLGDVARQIRVKKRELTEMVDSLQAEGRVRLVGEGGNTMLHFVPLHQARAVDGLKQKVSEGEEQRQAAILYGTLPTPALPAGVESLEAARQRREREEKK